VLKVSKKPSSPPCILIFLKKVDIYDGDQEPMVFHGKSFTSKVSLREVCEAILKYGFVASPYPIIISAEIHCSIGQQDLIAAIMMQVFGEKLVKMPIMTDGGGGSEKEAAGLVEGLVMMTNGKMEVDELPSPEQLKGRILLKVSEK
jgi:phosphatidylinositol phospholipase C delta